MTDDTYLYLNGINAVDGDYLLPPLKPELIVKLAQGERLSRKDFHFQDLQRKQAQTLVHHLGPAETVDPKKLEESGWGILFAYGADPAIKDGLSVLLRHRKEQATKKNERFYREFVGADAYRPGETKLQFLERHGVGPGPVDPANGVPYYLLLVGDPESIPYWFQFQLDVQFAVGRIYFDTPQDYACYAQSVVESETGKITLPKQVAFFGARNENDVATNLSADQLIVPLAQEIGQKYTDWTIRQQVGEGQATKNTLGHLLGGDNTPALLFTASHGVGFPKDHELQIRHQGALVCQDWPGPQRWRKPLGEDFYFAGEDIGDNARIFGLIAFFFACFGVGTPKVDAFYRQAFKDPQEIASRSFVGNLPQRMLGHPKGGALAVIGHVDRAWGYSFLWGRANSQLEVFTSTLTRLMDGHPIGSAVEFFNERYAEISADLTAQLEAKMLSKNVSDLELAQLWTANNDARNYAIIGDPAVRLPVGKKSGSVHLQPRRPTISLPVQPVPKIRAPSVPNTAFALVSDSPDKGKENVSESLVDAFLPIDSSLQKRKESITFEPVAIPTQPDTATKLMDPTGVCIQQSPMTEQSRIVDLMKRWYKARVAETKARQYTEQCLQELEKELQRLRHNR
jgi:hypothetical protein